MGKIRGTHSSPGVYTKFTDISYAVNSFGITSLGLVGETLKGPAFEPMLITDWGEFESMYGGTSPELYKGSNYPRYELPYIAKEYLSVSNKLYVSKVLGFSGYNAGPAYPICIKKDGKDKKYVVAVLRSKAVYSEYSTNTDCSGDPSYDTPKFILGGIKISESDKYKMNKTCEGYSTSGDTDADSLEVTANNFGRFKIEYTYTTDNSASTKSESIDVSFNTYDSNYILDVVGNSSTDKTDLPFYIEALYDNFIAKIVENSTERLSISTGVTDSIGKVDMTDENTIKVRDFVKSATPKPSMMTKTYYYDGDNSSDFKYYVASEGSVEGNWTYKPMLKNHIYKVNRVYNGKDNIYVYEELPNDKQPKQNDYIYVTSEKSLYQLKDNELKVEDLNKWDYMDEYSCASTPWIVSELKGRSVKKLFRLHTVSDGNAANSEIKISFENINYDEKTFDIVIRDFNDSDSNPTYLEIYRNLNLAEGTKNYAGLKIGTTNGEYERKSKYVTIEFAEGDLSESVPAGFIGYPVGTFGEGYEKPEVNYRTTYGDNERPRKIYFGITDTSYGGIDVDMFTYKGKTAYNGNTVNISKGFHMDGRIEAISSGLTVDGESGYTFDCVDGGLIGTYEEMSSNETFMLDDKRFRKFTVVPCGGFDGWDIHRTTRTTGNKYSALKYRGLTTNVDSTFKNFENADVYGISEKSITSDYYAFLAAAKQFENPEMYSINIFATPGIDYVNDQDLSNEILDMIEEERGDSIYVMTTPDKPFGASDNIEDMYAALDVVDNLEQSEIDTYYATTYFPWIKYYDADNSKYIMLPATKDAIRNMADVDVKKFPWYTPAGTERGNVNCVKTRIFSKLDMEDELYNGRINAVKTFSKDGVKIWGNKTMYTGDTPMNRINVVRLMLYMRKIVIEASRHFIFEQNDPILKGNFEKELKKILDDIKKNRGISKYEVKVSQTPEEMDAHEMNGTIYVKPIEALEYLGLNFVVTPNGVEFDIV